MKAISPTGAAATIRVVLEFSIKCPPKIKITITASNGWIINLKSVIKIAIFNWPLCTFFDKIIPSANRAHGAAERETNSNVRSIPTGNSKGAKIIIKPTKRPKRGGFTICFLNSLNSVKSSVDVKSKRKIVKDNNITSIAIIVIIEFIWENGNSKIAMG